MDVISLRLRPIQPSQAARAIGRFLAQRGAEDDDAQQDGLSADTLEQLRGMRAALQASGKAKKSRTSRHSSSSAVTAAAAAAAAAPQAAAEGEGGGSGAGSSKRRRL